LLNVNYTEATNELAELRAKIDSTRQEIAVLRTRKSELVHERLTSEVHASIMSNFMQQDLAIESRQARDQKLLAE
jgi:hypothetical protein